MGDLTGSESETVVNRIILFTMGTGLLTSLCAIMALIMVRILALSLGLRSLNINLYFLIDVCFFKHLHLHGILLQHLQMYVTLWLIKCTHDSPSPALPTPLVYTNSLLAT